MRVLVIDNYDSFTYNLVQYLGELGAACRVVRNDVWTVADVVREAPDKIVLSPGPCTPNEAGICLPILEQLAGKVPILGVCLGHQSIGQAFGGRVVRAPRLMHGKTSAVEHEGVGIFRDLPRPMIATRYHSLVVEPETLPSSLEVVAWTDDGKTRPTIMALRHRTLDVWGVQFHPESILTTHGKHLLANWLGVPAPAGHKSEVAA